MNLSPHEIALKAISENLLPGHTQEVTIRRDICFGEITFDMVGVDDVFTYAPNRILHILNGNGVEADKVIDCIKRGYAHSRRLLILEHNPDAFPEANPKDYFRIEGAIPSPVKKIDLGRRNTLWITTNLPDWDDTANSINAEAIERDIIFDQGAGIDRWECLLFSSERQADGRLLTEQDAEFVRKAKGPVYCVCGGLMFLNLIAETGKPVILIDKSLKQLLYAKAVVDTIKMSSSLEQFDRNLNHPVVTSIWPKAIDYLMVEDHTCVHWYNIPRTGHWRENYLDVRNLPIRFKFGSLLRTEIPMGAVLYASTVPPNEYENLNAHVIIEAFTERDVPRLCR